MALHQSADNPLTPKHAISGWISMRQAALKAVLLTGLLLTGLVDEGANANTSRTGPERTNTQQDKIMGPYPALQERLIMPTGPATVELRIEGDGFAITRILYFPPDAIDLTREARLALAEITQEISTFQNPSILLSSQDGDRLLTFERINTVANELERGGFDQSRLFTWSDLDILTARTL